MTDQHDHKHDDEIDCLIAIEHIHAYIDGELNSEEMRPFEQHLGHCSSCFSRKELEMRITNSMQESTKDEIPDSLQQRIRGLLDNL